MVPPLVSLIIAAVLNALANIAMKFGAKHGTVSGRDWIGVTMLLNPLIVLGTLSFVLALGFYLVALRRAELSLAYPVMTSIGMALVSVVSVVGLHETFSLAKGIGLCMIGVGLFLVAWKS